MAVGELGEPADPPDASPAGPKMSPGPSLPLTPQQAAGQALARAARNTTLRVDSNVTVAGEAAYQLVLLPKSPGSLIGQVRIAIDARRHVPLRVQVSRRARPARLSRSVSPPYRSAGQPRRISRSGLRPGGGRAGTHRARRAQPPAGYSAVAPARPGVIGGDWLAIADLPESALSSLAGAGPSARRDARRPGCPGIRGIGGPGGPARAGRRSASAPT